MGQHKALWAKSKETHNYIQIYSDLTSPEFGQADVSWLPSLSICLTSHWTDAVVVHPASILDVSDGVSKPVQYHSVLMRYWFQMWKKTVVSSCNSGHSSILKLQCIVLKNKLTELSSCSSAGKVTGLISREHTCRVRPNLHRKHTVNGADTTVFFRWCHSWVCMKKQQNANK